MSTWKRTRSAMANEWIERRRGVSLLRHLISLEFSLEANACRATIQEELLPTAMLTLGAKFAIERVVRAARGASGSLVWRHYQFQTPTSLIDSNIPHKRRRRDLAASLMHLVYTQVQFLQKNMLVASSHSWCSNAVFFFARSLQTKKRCPGSSQAVRVCSEGSRNPR